MNANESIFKPSLYFFLFRSLFLFYLFCSRFPCSFSCLCPRLFLSFVFFFFCAKKMPFARPLPFNDVKMSPRNYVRLNRLVSPHRNQSRKKNKKGIPWPTFLCSQQLLTPEFTYSCYCTTYTVVFFL